MGYAKLLVLDTLENRLSEQSLELLSFAATIGEGENNRTLLFLPGRKVSVLGAELVKRYGLSVVVCEHEQLHYPNPELLKLLLLEVLIEYPVQLVCFQHSMRNCQTAAALSVALDASSITAVESISVSEAGWSFRRSIMNGKLVQRVRPTKLQAIVTILPGAYSMPEALCDRTGAAGQLYQRTYPLKPSGYVPQEICCEDDSGIRIEDAEVIIAAGRGVRKKESLELLEETTRLFPNAAIGVSRPLCDLKWLPFSHQVGMTGKVVAPRLYMACGISGANQHLVGMKGSQCIVAINTDPHAAIFSVADYIVIDDLHLFLPLLIQKYQERLNYE